MVGHRGKLQLGELGGAHQMHGIGRIDRCLRCLPSVTIMSLFLSSQCHGTATSRLPSIRPFPALFAWQWQRREPKGPAMTDRDETFAKVAELIEPFNKKGVALDRGDHLRRRPRMGQPGGDGFRRLGRGRVRHPDHDEHAGRDRDGRPARRCGRELRDESDDRGAAQRRWTRATSRRSSRLGPRPLLQVRRADRRAPGPARHRRRATRSGW